MPIKVPVYRQLESNDCGPTCVKMIAAGYGKKYSLSFLKELCDITRIGASANDLAYCCRSIGFKVATVNINHSELRRIPCPAILYYKAGHFVVLGKVECKRDKYLYHLIDPSYGRVKITEKYLEEKLITNDRSIAIVLEPEEDFLNILPEEKKKENSRAQILSLLKDFYTRHKKSAIGISALTVITLAANWAMPLLLQKTIDDGIMNKDIGFVWLLLLAQLLFFIGFIVANNITSLLTSKVGFKTDIELTSKYLNKLISLPIVFFDTRFRSDYIQRLSDQSRIRNFLVDNVYGMILTLLNILVFSTILLVFNYNIFILFFLFSVMAFIYNSVFLKKRKYLDYSLFSLDSERRNTIYELIMGMPEIKINNAENTRVSAWEEVQHKINKLRLKSLYLNYYMSSGSTFFNKLRDIVITGLCAFLVISDNMTLGTMMMISYLLGQLSGPIDNTIKYSKTIQDTKLAYDRLTEVYDKPNEEDGGEVLGKDQPLTHGVKISNLSFKYPGHYSPLVLENINLSIPTGKTTAIVGSSGSGKTTLLKILLGFYKPTQGDIEIENIDSDLINIKSWRDKCGVVMQDGYIFSGTIAENIALSDPKPNEEKLHYAIKIACLEEKVAKLPMGVNTQIGESGLSLSGGEKQRLFIARAVYKDPQFIFFDEATSHLDANNEKQIISNLDTFFQGKTVILIAHRLSTIQNADNIAYIENGQIVEQGTHSELIKNKNAYYKLVKNQLELSN